MVALRARPNNNVMLGHVTATSDRGCLRAICRRCQRLVQGKLWSPD